MTEKKVIENELSIKYINERIKQEICYETLEELTDSKLHRPKRKMRQKHNYYLYIFIGMNQLDLWDINLTEVQNI